MHKYISRLGSALLATVMLAGCSKTAENSAADSTAASNSSGLTGAGSTFVNPIMTHWAPEYQKAASTTVNYQSVGSGAGINNLIDHTVDFGASDAPMNPGELARAKDPVVHVPDVIGAVCVSYNVAGMQSGLHLSGPVLANIYLGKIKNWNDPEIVKLNPGKKLPNAAIFTIHRSDGSGTTAIFTDYLSKVSPDWKSVVGEGKEVKWPEGGLGGKGNEGVAGVLKQHDNSIGYVELAYAMQNSIPFADMQNSSGNFVTPSVASAATAATTFPMPENMTSFITNTSAPQGYPITGFSWLIFFPNGPKADQVKKFMNWVITTGQKDNEALYYAPLPQTVVTAIQAQLQTAAPTATTSAPAQ
ncbi:MAG TPA: phosphate ABC transporter substrate-binding protein PstS [Candidatus Kapabacteria bacterium]|nr:phosphate ABC transporter substrate-binding protein PstS [Candidatus Kapabacteria bacterium]